MLRWLIKCLWFGVNTFTLFAVMIILKPNENSKVMALHDELVEDSDHTGRDSMPGGMSGPVDIELKNMP